MSPFVLWACPGCEMHVRVRGATEVIHECWRNSYRVTSFKPVQINAEAVTQDAQ